jgi:hypothetical protein
MWAVTKQISSNMQSTAWITNFTSSMNHTFVDKLTVFRLADIPCLILNLPVNYCV